MYMYTCCIDVQVLLTLIKSAIPIALLPSTTYSNKQISIYKSYANYVHTSCPPGLAETGIIEAPLNLVVSSVRLILLDICKLTTCVCTIAHSIAIQT